MQLALVLVLVFSVAIAAFAVQNTTLVALNFFGFRADQVAVSLLVLVATALGAALTFTLGLVREVQHHQEVHALREQLREEERRGDELEAQLAQQDQLPDESASDREQIEAPERSPGQEPS